MAKRVKKREDSGSVGEVCPDVSAACVGAVDAVPTAAAGAGGEHVGAAGLILRLLGEASRDDAAVIGLAPGQGASAVLRWAGRPYVVAVRRLS